jgi:CysZ protein
MSSIACALAAAVRDLARPRVLALLFLPMVGAIVLWSLLAWFFWDAWTEFFRVLLEDTRAARWLIEHGGRWVVESVTFVMLIALLLPAILITSTLITAIAVMPAIVSVVERAYPALAKRSGGTTMGSILNGLIATVLFACLWIVTLPLWLTGVGAVVLPALNSAYLNQRLFRYDALAEHATAEEYRLIVKRAAKKLYALGFTLSLLYYVPLVNLVVPVVMGLAYTHFCLRELEVLRRTAGE